MVVRVEPKGMRGVVVLVFALLIKVLEMIKGHAVDFGIEEKKAEDWMEEEVEVRKTEDKAMEVVDY